jgi:hypothetical protein
MNKDGKILCSISICLIEFDCLAVQNERGPRQIFPERHSDFTCSAQVKNEVDISNMFTDSMFNAIEMFQVYHRTCNNASNPIGQNVSVDIIVQT